MTPRTAGEFMTLDQALKDEGLPSWEKVLAQIERERSLIEELGLVPRLLTKRTRQP